jgi:phosphatidylethanolamine-binding protein (PEBP) family uncharacterized protein
MKSNTGYVTGCVITAFVFIFTVSTVSSKEVMMGKLHISSSAFEHNGNIPVKYTCDGKDINPPLTIKDIPSEAKSLVLIVDDPDAPMGTWVHWVVWNIDPQNDFRKHDYGGPCPPSGTHRYFFKLYALSSSLDLPSSSKKADVEKAMKGHMISESQIIGLYKRK